MTAGTHYGLESPSDLEPDESPTISVCESRPGTAVFLESGNTDGWIATDLTVDVTR